jgi:hypothetical protein
MGTLSEDLEPLPDRWLNELRLAHRASEPEGVDEALSVELTLRRESRDDVRKRLIVPRVKISSVVMLKGELGCDSMEE